MTHTIPTIMRGFALLELMVALAIGCFMLSSVFEVYLAVQQHANNNAAAHLISQQQLLITNLLQQQISGVGFLGCASWRDLLVYDDRYHNFIPAALTLYTAAAVELPNNIAQRIKPGTVALQLRQMDFAITDVTTVNTAGDIIINYTSTLAAGDTVVIASCSAAEINTITTITQLANQQRQQVTLRYPLKYTLAASTVIGKYRDQTFYVGDSGRENSTKQPIYALYLTNANNSSEEVSDVVSNMQLAANMSSNDMITLDKSTADVDLTQHNLLTLRFTLTVPSNVNGMILQHTFDSSIWLQEAF